MEQRTYNGILLICKEKGYTSNDVVALLRKFLKMKKIGHTGTLDPDATGLLPVCLGRGTGLVNLITDRDKTYDCVMRLGVTTDTEDMSGQILEKRSLEGIGETEVKKAAEGFVGQYGQIPPMYSAKKVNGKKLYEYAREGKVIDRKPSTVFIHSLEINRIELPLVEFEVNCSKGTYIRSLCRDIGGTLGCGAAMESLVRTRVGNFDIKDAHTLEEVKAAADKDEVGSFIMPVESFFTDCKAFVSPDLKTDKAIRNGNRLKLDGEGRYRVYLSDESFAAVYDVKNGEAWICGYFLT